MFVIGMISLFIGLIFTLIGSYGVIQLPDFYTRAHAATKPDTLGLFFSMLGLYIIWSLIDGQWFSPTHFKLLLITAFIGITNPTSAHALGRVAFLSRFPMWNSTDLINDSDTNANEKGQNE